MAVESAPVTLVDSSLAFCIDDQAVPESRQLENSLSRSCYWLGAPSFDFEGGSDIRNERSRKRPAIRRRSPGLFWLREKEASARRPEDAFLRAPICSPGPESHSDRPQKQFGSPSPRAQRTYFLGSHLLNGRQAKRVELAHGLLVHSAHSVQINRRLVDGGHGMATIFLRHSHRSHSHTLAGCPTQAAFYPFFAISVRHSVRMDSAFRLPSFVPRCSILPPVCRPQSEQC